MQAIATKQIVDIKTIEHQEITETIPSTGRVNAEYFVDVVARVDGYLQKKYFQEGSMVQKGSLLFLIEPRSSTNFSFSIFSIFPLLSLISLPHY